MIQAIHANQGSAVKQPARDKFFLFDELMPDGYRNNTRPATEIRSRLTAFM